MRQIIEGLRESFPSLEDDVECFILKSIKKENLIARLRQIDRQIGQTQQVLHR
jgi:hypothetical protein